MGAALWVIVVPLIPAVHSDVRLATLEGRSRLGTTGTTFAAPPLGSVSAQTHLLPIALRVSVSRLDVAELEQAGQTGFSRQDLAAEIEAGLRDLANRLALQLVTAGLIAGLVAGLLVPRRDLVTAIAGTAGGACAAVIAVGVIAATFDHTAFEEPSFTGALTRAPEVVDAVSRSVTTLDDLESRYEALAGRWAQVLELAVTPSVDVPEAGVALLHVSDIHSNPAGLETTLRLARAFDVDAIVDTGDLTSFGQSIEGEIGELIDDLPVPYIFVPGNHDSPENREAIASIDGVDLLEEGETIDVDGVSILGWADPTFTASNEISTEEGNAIRSATASDVAAAVEREAPDVVAVHDVRLAAESLGDLPLVLAGHTHERSMTVTDGTLVLTVGSTGATGVGSFLVETDLPYEAQVVYLRDEVPVALDYISLSHFGTEFDVERRRLDAASTPEAPETSATP